MNYAKWITYFAPDATEGFTPDSEVGDLIEGAVAMPDFKYIGYIANDLDLTGLEKYEIVLLTAEEALALAKTINEEIYFNEEGRFTVPPYSIEG